MTSTTTESPPLPGDGEPEPLAVSIKRLGAMLGISERAAWELVRDGHVQSVYLGQRRLVLVESVKAFLASLPTTR